MKILGLLQSWSKKITNWPYKNKKIQFWI